MASEGGRIAETFTQARRRYDHLVASVGAGVLLAAFEGIYLRKRPPARLTSQPLTSPPPPHPLV